MKNLILIAFFLMITTFVYTQQQNGLKYKTFDDYPIYKGEDLGCTLYNTTIYFKVWSPAAEEMKLRIYKEGKDGISVFEKNLTYNSENGVWSIEIQKDFLNHYYTFQAKINDKWMNEVPDPYAKAVGVNGLRGMILDFSTTNPQHFSSLQNREFKTVNDIIIYEAHIRDISTSSTSGIKNKGKFLGLTELGTKNPKGFSTGISHIKEMGITHLHLLPVFDYSYRSVDEEKLEKNQFNWGYDPQNYNALEGSYSTNPYDGNVRVKEFKQMVNTLHQNGIAVVMDVVYNHTGFTNESVFNQLVPGYYYRQRKDGSFSDASACGNETASDRFMMRKFMIESLQWWMNEYKIDGFRFDLMAIHDIETMNIISEELHKINPKVFLYGEGWTAGDSPLAFEKRALKQHGKQLNNIAVFSDDIRDGIKGHWSNVHEKGFVSGNKNLKEVVKFGIIASTNHPQIMYDKSRNYAQFPYATQPSGVIGYVSCHDNNTLYDKLKIANPEASEEELVKMHKLANTIVLTSQSIPFLHFGVEMKRTKNLVENSFNSHDSINQINWNWKTENIELVQYYQQLIKLRKNHPAFKMQTEKQIQENLKFIENNDPLLIEYQLNGKAVGDSWSTIYVALNGDNSNKNITLPEGKWKVVLDGETIELKPCKKAKTTYKVPSHSAVILIKK